MTYEEAIKKFERYIDNEAYTDSFQDACRMAIEELGKQIEKKARIYKVRYNDLEHTVELVYFCPHCDKRISQYAKRCGCCGQAIDWSDDE